MIYSACILDSITKKVIQRVQINSEKPEEINLLPGTELSSRHDGDFGWTLLENGEWEKLDPPVVIDTYLSIDPDRYVRNIRDSKLRETDKYSFQDFPITQEKRNEWFVYRQALRDITSQPGFPGDVVWPNEPAP